MQMIVAPFYFSTLSILLFLLINSLKGKLPFFKLHLSFLKLRFSFKKPKRNFMKPQRGLTYGCRRSTFPTGREEVSE